MVACRDTLRGVWTRCGTAAARAVTGAAVAVLAAAPVALMGAPAAAQTAEQPADPAAPNPALTASWDPGGPPEARVLLTPRREAVLAAELAGRILRIPVEDAGRFKEGDVLVAFACDLHEAALAEERATHDAARATLKNRQDLAALRSTGDLDVALAEAEVRRTSARVAMQRGVVERCTIRAPFPGRVVQRLAQPHESVSAGAPLLAVLDDGELDLEMVVPSDWLGWLRVDAPLQVRIDETGTVHDAKVRSIGARIDAVSQSVPIRATLTGSANGLLAGMSGTALFAAAAR